MYVDSVKNAYARDEPRHPLWVAGFAAVRARRSGLAGLHVAGLAGGGEAARDVVLAGRDAGAPGAGTELEHVAGPPAERLTRGTGEVVDRADVRVGRVRHLARATRVLDDAPCRTEGGRRNATPGARSAPISPFSPLAARRSSWFRGAAPVAADGARCGPRWVGSGRSQGSDRVQPAESGGAERWSIREHPARWLRPVPPRPSSPAEA